MASIYAARDELTNHRVALKVLYPYYSDNAIIRARFVEEGRIQQQLRHPNIIRVFQIQDVPFLAILMEFVEGPTLDDFLASNGPLSSAQIVDVFIPMMSAVGFAHSQGVIHRDIKPSNILLPDGDLQSPKVLDFGVAKIKGGRHDLTATGTTVGTLHYMSPEQIVGSKSIDGRADIYSLGVMMYKLVTGEVPFNAPTEFALMMAQVEAPPLPPSHIQPGIDPSLERIILKAMEKKPQDRFHTIRDFTQALLDMRVGNRSTVADTVNGRISSELLSYAINADEIAVDRTDDDTFGRTDRIEAVFTLPMDQATMEIEATLKIERTPHPEMTAELSNSAIVRISNASLAMSDENLETEAIIGLKERLRNEDVTRMAPSKEIQLLIENSQSQEVAVAKSSGRQTLERQPSGRQPIERQPSGRQPLERQPSGRQPLERQTSGRQPQERQPSGRQPSGRNPIAKGENLDQNTFELPVADHLSTRPSGLHRGPPLATGTQPLEADDFETVSVARPMKVKDLQPRAQPPVAGLRHGVLNADPHLDSSDLTAPKMSREKLMSYLPTPAIQPAPQPAPPPSGPKLVLGKNYADTSERTREKPPTLLEQQLINSAPSPLRSGYQPSPDNPHDGRMQQRVERNVSPTVPANEMQQMLAGGSPHAPNPFPMPAPLATPDPQQEKAPEINKVWFLVLMVAVGIIAFAGVLLLARLS
jgi:serine/threonine protein kinase